MATTNSTVFSFPAARERSSSRNLAEIVIGFAAIMAVLWLPTREQVIAGPIVLLTPLGIVLAQKPSRDELGLGIRGFVSSWWILPAAICLMLLGILVTRAIGTYHSLHAADFAHVGGYILWTIYQQFLLQDYFMPRLTRLLTGNMAIFVAAILFSVAHLPNVPLVSATLLWGAVSCLLFRRYRSLWILGLAQGMLGLCFAVCIPDAWHHHMRVGLGYFHFRG